MKIINFFLVATIGGLIGELWLILDALQAERKIDIKLEELVQVFVKLLSSEKYNLANFPVYLREESQEVIQNVRKQMEENLFIFNENKAEKIEEIYNQISDINSNQTLNILSSQGLLDKSLFKNLNKALLYIYFTSVDYKIPQPKQVVPTEEPKPVESNDVENPEEVDEKEEVPAPVPVEVVEYQIPETTEAENEILQILGRLNMNFVNSWEFKKEFDGVLRFRVPLNRNPVVEKEEAEIPQGTQETEQDQRPEEKPVVEETQEEADERLRRWIVSDEFIEPFDGTTFEKEKLELPGKNFIYG